jgi:hypothetical protein
MSERSVVVPFWLPWMPVELWEELDPGERTAVLEGRLTEADLHDLCLALRHDGAGAAA